MFVIAELDVNRVLEDSSIGYCSPVDYETELTTKINDPSMSAKTG